MMLQIRDESQQCMGGKKFNVQTKRKKRSERRRDMRDLSNKLMWNRRRMRVHLEKVNAVKWYKVFEEDENVLVA